MSSVLRLDAFALDVEDPPMQTYLPYLQPSGTCNFSRIDSTTLIFSLPPKPDEPKITVHVDKN